VERHELVGEGDEPEREQREVLDEPVGHRVHDKGSA